MEDYPENSGMPDFHKKYLTEEWGDVLTGRDEAYLKKAGDLFWRKYAQELEQRNTMSVVGLTRLGIMATETVDQVGMILDAEEDENFGEEKVDALYQVLMNLEGQYDGDTLSQIAHDLASMPSDEELTEHGIEVDSVNPEEFQ